MYVNLKGREPEGIVAPGAEYEAVRREVVAALRALREPGSGRPLSFEAIPGESYCHGPYDQYGPDPHLILDGYRAIAFPLFASDGRIVTPQIRGDSGCHRREGLLIAAGPGIHSDRELQGAEIVDLAPTILHAFGLPVPDDMDGKVLTGLFTRADPVVFQPQAEQQYAQVALSQAESREVENRLRELGYLG